MSEQQIQSQIIKYLESIGAYTIKVITANHAGVPDIQACLNGRWISIEVKQPGKSPEPLQYHHLSQIQKAGGLATWANSLDQVIEFLSHHNLLDIQQDDI